MSLFEELKRRNVFRVGAAYVVVSWLLLQVIDVVAPILELPAWAPKLVLLIVATGFIPALLFAWAFELTPEGVKRERDIDRSLSITHKTGHLLNRVIIAVLALVILIMGAERLWNPLTETTTQQAAVATSTPESSIEPTHTLVSPPDKSIAVLPFTNRSAGTENTGFFSDGIHDDLLTQLSKIHELKVISRTSVMGYRDTTKNMREIGNELGVSSLLEGGVQQVGDRVRINVQLINARTDKHLWAETYDRQISTETIFEIQGEIALAIANALEATLTTDEEGAIGVAPTHVLKAYEAVLASRQSAHRGGFDANEKGVEFARTALKLDPEYADAHLALAYNLVQGIITGSITENEAGPEILGAIDTAMSLKPDYDQAWAVLGSYQSAVGDPAAEGSFKKALSLNPGNAQILYDYGFMLQRTGRPQDALPLLLKSSELNPLSASTLFALGRTNGVLEKYDDARRFYARIREIDPSSPLGYAPVTGTYWSQGQLDKGLYWLGAGRAIDPADYEIVSFILALYDTLEDYVTAQEWSDWLDSWVTNQPLPMAMKAMHDYQTGKFEMAVQYSNLALNLGLPDRWGSDAVFMRIKRDEALANGDPVSGIDVFRKQHPALFEPDPQVTEVNIQQAVDLAMLLKLSDQTVQMQRLLEAAIEFYDQPWSVTGGVRASLVPAKAETLAILGDEEGALKELRRIIDKGWRLFWRWETDLNPNFNGLREHAIFQGMISELEADISLQRANVHVMVHQGRIELPPRTGIEN